MIEASNISKTFNGVSALGEVSFSIKSGSIFGLIGTNGAGKSTLLRILAGILRQDHGTVTIDGKTVFNNNDIKKDLFFISDQQHFFANSTPEDMKAFYKNIYPNFDEKLFDHLMKNFELPSKRKINNFSKGMKKQVAIICSLAAKTKYIFCDETFDGLDPVIRQGVKGLFAAEVAERELTPIIASHNLRELEDICDHVGLLHSGRVILNRDLDDMKLGISKIQCIFTSQKTRDSFSDIDIISMDQRGSLYTIIARGEADKLAASIKLAEPEFIEVLPLTLEEIFISETEVFGYDIKKLLV